MQRMSLHKGYDKKVFRKTAEKTKIVNTSSIIPRGGIRL